MPKNPHYASPLNIKLLDERLFGWTSVVGTSVVSLGPYLSDGQDKLESLAKSKDHTACSERVELHGGGHIFTMSFHSVSCPVILLCLHLRSPGCQESCESCSYRYQRVPCPCWVCHG